MSAQHCMRPSLPDLKHTFAVVVQNISPLCFPPAGVCCFADLVGGDVQH